MLCLSFWNPLIPYCILTLQKLWKQVGNKGKNQVSTNSFPNWKLITKRYQDILKYCNIAHRHMHHIVRLFSTIVKTKLFSYMHGTMQAFFFIKYFRQDSAPSIRIQACIHEANKPVFSLLPELYFYSCSVPHLKKNWTRPSTVVGWT